VFIALVLAIVLVHQAKSDLGELQFTYECISNYYWSAFPFIHLFSFSLGGIPSTSLTVFERILPVEYAGNM
jgi:hypothetical protein